MSNQNKALLIGINYINTPNELYGCWSDVYAVFDYLNTIGYNPGNIIILTDEDRNKNTKYYPTAANIKTAISNFVSSAKSGDKLFFHYSGHGGSVRDTNGDEGDGRDECIFPCDNSIIIDDELRVILCNAVPDGVILRCILDCCHSGSSLDLPWRCLPSKKNIRENKSDLAKDIIAISGCKDTQTSADTVLNDKPSGALTGFLLRILKYKHSNMRWVDLIQVLQHELSSNGYSQVPQLSFAEEVATKKLVDI
jgi:hypothetical protein